MQCLRSMRWQRLHLRAWIYPWSNQYCESSTASLSDNTDGQPPIVTPPMERDKFGHPRLPHRGHFEEDKCNERRAWVEQFTGTKLNSMGDWWTVNGKRDEEASQRFPTTLLKGNVENPVGIMGIPVCATGPLLVRGKRMNNSVIVPYATGEAGLSASATRGAQVLNLSGGAVARVSKVTLRRSPAYRFSTVKEAFTFAKWVEGQHDNLALSMKDVSEHGRLQRIKVFVFGRQVTVNFFYLTGDAAGQNMVTSLTNKAHKWIVRAVKEGLAGDVTLRRHVIEDLFSGDKRAAVGNALVGRGMAAHADAYIPNSVLESVLKVSAERLLRCFQVCSEGSMVSGAGGIQLSNADCLIAIFLATGQDVACVVEATHSNVLSVKAATAAEISHARKRLSEQEVAPSPDLFTENYSSPGIGKEEGGVYVSLSIPVLPVGTVGGGAMLPTQKECLSIMGCHGNTGALRFAEVLAASALGLEVSVLASIASGRHMYSLEGPVQDRVLGRDIDM